MFPIVVRLSRSVDYFAIDMIEEVPYLCDPSPLDVFYRTAVFQYGFADACFHLDDIQKSCQHSLGH
jgi:hypothetical protein